MFSRLKILCAAGLLVFGILSLTPAVAQQDTPRVEADFFENKIRPVLVERCLKCHSGEGKARQGGIGLNSRERLPAKQLLLQAIQRTDDDHRLTPLQVQDFVAWVKMGLPYPANKPTINREAARQFWSYQPLKQSAPPTVKESAWTQTPIDQFILAKLEEKGIKPAPVADLRTLLRRATYDLTGLPPTAEEMEAFEKESALNPQAAYEKVIDRLLASPQYGVKWGRHWLDVARYGDTRWVGAGEDRRWPFAYTYRDWVIRSLNADMPYDRFITLQLAADQTPGALAADQAALGFLTVGRWFTGNLHDVIDDQIDVVTRGILGLSVQCARCHDHKYDPISAKDYYSLYGLFAASRMPVEGSGLIAELPETEARPVDALTEKELSGLRKNLDQFLTERLNTVRKEFRSPDKMEEYLLAAESVVKKTDNDVRALAKAKNWNEPMLFRWVRFLQRSLKNPQPIFGPWHAFAALPESEFAAKAISLAEQEKSSKAINKHVAAILTPAPKSLNELAHRYIQLFLKFDSAEQSTDNDQEMLRQVLQNNDSPVQIPLNELAQYLTKEEKDRAYQMRRAILAKQTPLSEKADQFLSYQHEEAAAVAEVNEFLQTRRTKVAAEIRSAAKIAEYLLAARDADGADEYRFKMIVNSRKLSDRLLHHWIDFLNLKAERNDSVFAAWRSYAALADKEFADKVAASTTEIRKSPRQRLVADCFTPMPASLKEVAMHYGELIVRLNQKTPHANPESESIRQIWLEADSPLCFELDAVLDYFTRKDFDELRGKENKLCRLYLDHPGAVPRAMILKESPRGYAQKVFVRGNPNILGEDSGGRFLSILAGEPPFQKGKGRWDLARAIVDPANPLTARVFVNRVWQWHFGTGLIHTPSDLGLRGERPTHSELLDWLAGRFVSDGWSLKKLHRQILLSATYRQASGENLTSKAIDPENRLLGRMNRRRLTFEEIRDSILATAGRLDKSLAGRPIDLTKADAERRTVYGNVDRIALPGFYRYFDFPTSDAHTPERHETLIPQQALYMMNNSFIMDQAGYLARRTEAPEGTPKERIASLYRLVYGRKPSSAELALGLEFTAAAPKTAEVPSSDPWRYGYGRYSEKEKRVVEFKPFPFFNGQWRGGPQEIDPSIGRCSLHAAGGNAGPDNGLAVIRRWIAPRDGKVSITGILSAQMGSLQPSGDGLRGRIVSSRKGQLGTWLIHGTEETTPVSDLEVKQGDRIDFIADGRGRDQSAGFAWSPVIRLEDKSAAKETKLLWDAAKDFKGVSAIAAKPSDVWERYAQVLLEANEFFFLD